MVTLLCGETMASFSTSTGAMTLLIFHSHVHLCGLIATLGRYVDKGIEQELWHFDFGQGVGDIQSSCRERHQADNPA
jgi:hypothetical protein